MKRVIALLLCVLACVLLQACALPRALPPATGPQAGAGEVVVIGKIELVPPIDRLEQRTHRNVIGEKSLLGRVFVATGPSDKPVSTPTLVAADFQEMVEAEWGVPFMVKVPRRRTYLNGAVVHLDVVERDTLWFPGGFYFDVPADAPAVYIGTLRYFRNDFNVITGVEIVDERKDVAVALKARGASTSDVRPSLLRRIR
jgi:hypothetical protein